MVSFSSPCAVPLIPSYLSYVSGLPIGELDGPQARALTLRATAGFVAGFTAVFTLMGVSSALVGSALYSHLRVILDISGVLVIAMGLAMAGLLRLPWLSRERRIDLARLPQGPRGALLLGMAFAFGWVPCLGPVLATLLGLAAASHTVAWGGLLLALYSLGLGVPFMVVALAFARARGSLAWLRRHGRLLERTGGLLLVAVGLLFVTGAWRGIFVPLQSEFARLGWPPV